MPCQDDACRYVKSRLCVYTYSFLPRLGLRISTLVVISLRLGTKKDRYTGDSDMCDSAPGASVILDCL